MAILHVLQSHAWCYNTHWLWLTATRGQNRIITKKLKNKSRLAQKLREFSEVSVGTN